MQIDIATGDTGIFTAARYAVLELVPRENDTMTAQHFGHRGIEHVRTTKANQSHLELSPVLISEQGRMC